MYVGQQRIFDYDIQIIAVEATLPAEPPPGKASSRNIKNVSKKRRKGKRPTPSPGSDRLSPSTPTPEHVISLPSTLESIH